MSRGQKFIKSLEAVAIIILVISFIVLAYCIYVSVTMEKSYNTQADYSAQKTSSVNTEKIENNISEIIGNVNESVVGISKIKSRGNTIFLNKGSEELGLGTGFIVTENGYIVTNEHVSGAKNATCYVTLEDGRQFEAKVVWSDSDIDLSIIKINMTSLKALELADSEETSIAQKVYAIGNPIGFEFQRTVTAGIVSGLDRTIKIVEDDKTSYMEDLIQTDATINLGNSGGPLINEDGLVIGINSVKITSAEGIGFAIPINIIKPIIEKFALEGEYVQPTLGIFAYDKNIIPYINSELKTNKTLESGIYVTSITKGSPAAKANINEGDIILQIDDIVINKMSELRTYIYSKNVGDEVKLKVLKNNKEQEINVVLAKK